MTDSLLERLLAIPVGPKQPRRTRDESDLTSEVEVNGDRATVLIGDENATEGTALEFLQAEGLDPEEWEVVGFRRSEWGRDGEGFKAVRFTFKRRKVEASRDIDIDALHEALLQHPRAQYSIPKGGYGAVVGIGDMQFGKIDGDGVEGTLQRTIDYINLAAGQIKVLSQLWPVSHVHVAWLGDHIEGFNSQGGANVWRTPLTLNQQIRLTRRVMLHALVTFAGLGVDLSMAAVPGNHGEPQRFVDKGVTRYDDSHDTEALIAVAEAAQLSPDYKDVRFYVPDTDEMTVIVDVAGTTVAHVHGHQWRPGKHFEWWRGQAFNPDSGLHNADVLLAGHLHHEHQEAEGRRLYIGVPALESESTWFRHQTGIGGNPGIFLGITKDGRFYHKSIVQN